MKLPTPGPAGALSRRSVLALLLFGLALPALAEAQQEAAQDEAHELSGYASWYGGKFQGRLTANGERFDTNELTAAHKTLPFDTTVEVRHLGNGRTVTVRINDRGPFVAGRVIDLSRAAADALRMTAEGIAAVEITVLSTPDLRFTLQIGSFGLPENAERMVNRLRAAGIAASVEPAGAVRRVVVKEIMESELDALHGRLETLGISSPLVREER